jgi:hypothetical protein
MVGFLRSVEKNARDERDYALALGFISEISENLFPRANDPSTRSPASWMNGSSDTPPGRE